MTPKLSEKEFKKLIIEVAINISPVLVKNQNDTVFNADKIALYAKEIAVAVNHVLANPSNNL